MSMETHLSHMLCITLMYLCSTSNVKVSSSLFSFMVMWLKWGKKHMTSKNVTKVALETFFVNQDRDVLNLYVWPRLRHNFVKWMLQNIMQACICLRHHYCTMHAYMTPLKYSKTLPWKDDRWIKGSISDMPKTGFHLVFGNMTNKIIWIILMLNVMENVSFVLKCMGHNDNGILHNLHPLKTHMGSTTNL